MEYAIAVLVRGALMTNDFSFFLYEVIRELFLHYEPSDTMRKFCSFFERYFEEKEFDTVISRIFGSKNEYYKASKTVRIHRDYLENHGTGILDEELDKYSLISYFENIDYFVDFSKGRHPPVC